MAVCSIEGCDKPVKGHGWCSTHYARWRRLGTPHLPERPTICTIEGCNDPVLARGWCSKHYARWQNHGDPEAKVIERDRHPPEICTIEGCEKPNRDRDSAVATTGAGENTAIHLLVDQS